MTWLFSASKRTFYLLGYSDLLRDKLRIRHVPQGDNTILFEKGDILVPNALGGVLNQNTIPNIKAKIICGAANNQLLEAEKDAQALMKAGITYVPDFVANRFAVSFDY